MTVYFLLVINIISPFSVIYILFYLFGSLCDPISLLNDRLTVRVQCCLLLEFDDLMYVNIDLSGIGIDHLPRSKGEIDAITKIFNIFFPKMFIFRRSNIRDPPVLEAFVSLMVFRSINVNSIVVELVRGKPIILKHSFIVWLAMRNRLATRARLLRWGLVIMEDVARVTIM